MIPNAYMFPCEGRTCRMLSSVGVRSIFTPCLLHSQVFLLSGLVTVYSHFFQGFSPNFKEINFRGLGAAGELCECGPRQMVNCPDCYEAVLTVCVVSVQMLQPLVCWISLSSFKNKLGVCGCLKCVESIRAVTGRSSFLDSFALGHCFVAASLQFGPLLLYRNV